MPCPYNIWRRELGNLVAAIRLLQPNRGFPAQNRSGGQAPALHGQGDIRLAQVLRLAQKRSATCTQGLGFFASPATGRFCNLQAEPAVYRPPRYIPRRRDTPPLPFVLSLSKYERQGCELNNLTAAIRFLPLPRISQEYYLRSAVPRRRTCQRDRAFPAPGRARRWLSSPARKG